jgi:xanthine dehydrogenase accessory factor
MREVLQDIERWLADGKAVALATVVSTWGSAPRAPGSKMAVSAASEMAGSVSAGCVEANVVEAALDVLRRGDPRKLEYGVSDETAWEVGLACGGRIEVFVEPLSGLLASPAGGGASALERIRRAVESQQVVVRAIVVEGPEDALGRSFVATADGDTPGSMPGDLASRIREDARTLLGAGNSECRSYPIEGREHVVFFDVMLPTPRLVIVGGVHIAVELTRLAKRMGYEVTIVDPRKAFATAERFPEADRLLHEWPDAALRAIGLTSGTAVAVLSHDPKIDDPALLVALRSPAFYVGGLGSLRTQELRRQRLAEAGLSAGEMARLHGPIGLDLGARSPVEIALSILAEIVAVRAGRASGAS